MRKQDWRHTASIPDPPFVHSLFSNPSRAWLWLIPRLYVAYTWLSAGLQKLADPAWMSTGAALQTFWDRAVALPFLPAHSPIAFDWYRAFIQSLLENGHYTWFARLIVISEILIGVALLAGAFTGIAAFLGGFMSWNFMLANTAGINPVLFTFSILLMLAWKIAGWWGLDRWLLPLVGVPWQPGPLFSRATRNGREQIVSPP